MLDADANGCANALLAAIADRYRREGVLMGEGWPEGAALPAGLDGEFATGYDPATGRNLLPPLEPLTVEDRVPTEWVRQMGEAMARTRFAGLFPIEEP